MHNITGAKGGGGGGSTTLKEDANTLRSNSILRFIDILGAGPIKGLVHPDDPLRDYYLDDTPVKSADGTINYPGVEIQTREGYPDQQPVGGFPEIETEYSVSTEVKRDTPLTRTISNLDANAVRVTISVPALTQTSEQGDRISGTRIDLVAETRSQNGSWVNRTPIIIEGKTTSEYLVAVRVALSGEGPWDVRVTRSTADSTTQRLQNTSIWASYTELVEGRYIWPNMAYLATKIDAQYFGSSVATRTFDIYGRIVRIPTNYDPMTRSYTGIWNGAFKADWTDNPAWVYFDLLTNTMDGAGAKKADALKWDLYEIAKVCDELIDNGQGGKEPRFSFNGVVDNPSDAYSVLQDVASTFNSMTYWAHDSIGIVQDYPQHDDGSVIFTRANVVDGEFNYSSTELSTRHSVAIVGYTDPDTWRTEFVTYVGNEAHQKVGWKDTTITMRGCTSRAMAMRRARWIIDSEWNQDGLLRFSAGRSYMSGLFPGRVISIYDPIRQGSELAGRIKDIEGGVVTIDRDIPSDLGNNQVFHLVMADDRLHTSPFRSSGRTVYLSQQPPVEVVDHAVWAISSGKISPQQYRITNIEFSEGSTYSIEALLHDETKYARIERGIMAEKPPTTLIPTGPVEPPLSITFRSYIYTSGTQEFQGLTVSWSPSRDSRVQAYQFQVREPDQSNWSSLQQTELLSVDIKDAVSGRWSFRVRSVGLLSQTSPWVSRIFDVGELLSPVAPLSVDVWAGNREITLTPRGSRSGQMYQFWRSSFALDTDKIESNAILIGEGTAITDVGLKSGTVYYYYVRGVNIHGVSGWFPTQAETTQVFDDELDAIEQDINRPGGLKDVLINGAKTAAEEAAAAELESARKEIADVKKELELDITGARQELEEATEQLSKEIGENGSALQALEKSDAEQTLRIEQALTRVGEAEATVQRYEKTEWVENYMRAIRLSGMSVKTQNASAYITAEQVVRASQDSALSQSIERMGSRVGDAEADITRVDTTSAQRDTALSRSIETMGARVGNNEANITRVDTTSVQRDTALSRSIETMGVRVGNNEAGIQEYRRLEWVENYMRGIRLSGMSVKTQNAAAYLNAEQVVRAGQGSALAQDIRTLGVTVGDQNAAVRNEITAIYDPRNGAVARAVTTVDVNGRRGMLGIQVDGQRAEIMGIADRFAILNEVSGQYITAFVVQDGRVVIPDALIREASITTAKIAEVLQSSNYQSGISGWRIVKSGSAEFNDVTIRGNIFANQFSARSADSGQRTEMDQNGIRVYDGAGRLRVRMGVW